MLHCSHNLLLLLVTLQTLQDRRLGRQANQFGQLCFKLLHASLTRRGTLCRSRHLLLLFVLLLFRKLNHILCKWFAQFVQLLLLAVSTI